MCFFLDLDFATANVLNYNRMINDYRNIVDYELVVVEVVNVEMVVKYSS